MRKMNKKGSLFDSITGLARFFIIAILMVSMFYLITTVADMNVFNTATSSAIVTEYTTNTLPIFDYIVPVLVIAFMTVSLLLTFNLPSNPTFFIYNIFLLIFGLTVSAGISNNWTDYVMSSSVLSTVSGSFTLTNYIMDKLPFLIAIFGLAMILVMLHLKSKTGDTSEFQ